MPSSLFKRVISHKPHNPSELGSKSIPVSQMEQLRLRERKPLAAVPTARNKVCFHCSHTALVSSACLIDCGIVYIHKNDTTNKNHRQEGIQLKCVKKTPSHISNNRADPGSNFKYKLRYLLRL